MKTMLLMMAASFCETVANYQINIDPNDIGIDDEIGAALQRIAVELRSIAAGHPPKIARP